MAHGGQILAPAKFVMPSNEELEDAIQKHVTEESADIDQDANGGIPTFASKAKKAKVDYPFCPVHCGWL